MNNDTARYAIYCYDPATGDLFAGEGHNVAVDLVVTTDDGMISTLWTASGFDTADEAQAAAEQHAGHNLDWSNRPENLRDQSGAYLLVAAALVTERLLLSEQVSFFSRRSFYGDFEWNDENDLYHITNAISKAVGNCPEFVSIDVEHSETMRP